MTTPRRDLTEAVSALPNAVNPLALSLNENPFPPLPGVRSALIESVDVANRYPEFLPERLRALIAGHIGVGEEQVVIGAGATGVIMQVLSAVDQSGGPNGDDVADVRRLSDLRPDGAAGFGHRGAGRARPPRPRCHGRGGSQARVVVVCRPHNPTGTVEPAADIELFLQRVPSDTVVLLDEAYVEFLAPEHRVDALALVERFPNVVVLRTFSKAYGLAGLRIGYGFCAPDLARSLWTMQLPFGIGITGLVAVAASYDAESQLQQRIRMIASERRYLRNRLHAMGVYSTDGHANFVYLPANSRPWRQFFEGSGLQIRELRRRQRADHRGEPSVHPGGVVRAGAIRVALNSGLLGAGLRYEEAWPQNRRPSRAREIRSRLRAPTGNAPAGVTSPTGWSRSHR